MSLGGHARATALGKPEKPAFAGEESNPDGSAILVKMINSSEGFPVDIVYATPIQDIDGLGKVSSRLPRPDMVVTQSLWDVFVPADRRYRSPQANMDITTSGTCSSTD